MAHGQQQQQHLPIQNYAASCPPRSLPRGITAKDWSGRSCRGASQKLTFNENNWKLWDNEQGGGSCVCGGEEGGLGKPTACCFREAVQLNWQMPANPSRTLRSSPHWLNWLRLLISIKAFNRQAPQTAGNILFIWGFCLHNRQASRQRIISTTSYLTRIPPPPATRSIGPAWPSGMWIKAWNIRAKLFARAHALRHDGA